MQPCEPPRIERLETNADLAEFASLAVRAYERCAAQLDALRRYYGLDDGDEKE